MKYLREILLCVVLTAACSVATLHGGDSLSLKIMTYNLRFGEKASLEELAEAIRAQRPDLVALQEIDCRTRRPGVERQHDKDFVTELGLRTGMFPLYGKTIPHAGGWYGIGILTAGPYISVQKLMLPQASATEEPRALLLATIEAGGDTIVFASTHLSLSAQSRRMQAEFIAREIGSLRFPALLGGDFNAGPNAPEIETMTRTGKMLCDRQPTFPADGPEIRLDYLFGFPAGKWRRESTRVVPSEFSDHRAVVSVVTPVR